MTSAKLLDFFTPPPCPHLGLIHNTKSMQLPLLLSNFDLCGRHIYRY